MNTTSIVGRFEMPKPWATQKFNSWVMFASANGCKAVASEVMNRLANFFLLPIASSCIWLLNRVFKAKAPDTNTNDPIAGYIETENGFKEVYASELAADINERATEALN